MPFVQIGISQNDRNNRQLLRSSIAIGAPVEGLNERALSAYAEENLPVLLKQEGIRQAADKSPSGVARWILRELRLILQEQRQSLPQQVVAKPYLLLRYQSNRLYLQVLTGQSRVDITGTAAFFRYSAAAPRPARDARAPQGQQAQGQQAQGQQAQGQGGGNPRLQQLLQTAARLNQLDAQQVQDLIAQLERTLEDPEVSDPVKQGLRRSRAAAIIRQQQLAVRGRAQNLNVDTLSMQTLATHRAEIVQIAQATLRSGQIHTALLEALVEGWGPYQNQQLDTLADDARVPMDAQARAIATLSPAMLRAYQPMANQALAAVLNHFQVQQSTELDQAIGALCLEAARGRVGELVTAQLQEWQRVRAENVARRQREAQERQALPRDLQIAQVQPGQAGHAYLVRAANTIGVWRQADYGARVIALSLAAVEAAAGPHIRLRVGLALGDVLQVRAEVQGGQRLPTAQQLAGALKNIRGTGFGVSESNADELAAALLAGGNLNNQDLEVWLW